jgi:hypothetical protein
MSERTVHVLDGLGFARGERPPKKRGPQWQVDSRQAGQRAEAKKNTGPNAFPFR